MALHLAKELCRTDEDGEHWVSVMKKVPVLPSVLSAVELSLRAKRNLYFTEAALHLLLTLARTPQVGSKLHIGFVYGMLSFTTCCEGDMGVAKGASGHVRM